MGSLVSSATELLLFVAKLTFRFGFVLAGVVAFIILLGIVTSFVFVGLNYTVLADIFALVQMWLPFNLNVILAWLISATVAYMGYRFAVVAIAFVDKLIPR